MERRHPRVVNLSEMPARTYEDGKHFAATMRRFGLLVGGQQIGCSWYEVPPGKAAYPFHFHCNNEEAVFVLDGEGALRIGKDTVALRAGDYVAFPIGPENAHQIRNTGKEPLRYLCISTMSTAEVVGYPDSNKIGAMAAASPEASARGEPWVRHLAFEGTSVGYYDGEDMG